MARIAAADTLAAFADCNVVREDESDVRRRNVKAREKASKAILATQNAKALEERETASGPLMCGFGSRK